MACAIWRGEITPAGMSGTERLGMRALENSPKGAGLLFYPETSKPSLEVREMSASINERLSARGAVGVAGVFLQSGFTGAIQRGIATGMTILSAHSYPMKLFGATDEAVEWLGGELRKHGVVARTQTIAADIGAFRERYLADGANVQLP